MLPLLILFPGKPSHLHVSIEAAAAPEKGPLITAAPTAGQGFLLFPFPSLASH